MNINFLVRAFQLLWRPPDVLGRTHTQDLIGPTGPNNLPIVPIGDEGGAVINYFFISCCHDFVRSF